MSRAALNPRTLTSSATDVAHQLICPTGKSPEILSSPPVKNNSLRHLVDTALLIPPSRLTRGAYRDRHGRGCGMRWTLLVRATNAPISGRRSRVGLRSRARFAVIEIQKARYFQSLVAYRRKSEEPSFLGRALDRLCDHAFPGFRLFRRPLCGVRSWKGDPASHSEHVLLR